jgi:hypothetical protein
MVVAVDFRRGLLGQRPPEVVEDEELFLLWLGDAGQADLAALTQVEPNFDHQDLLEAVQHLRRGEAAGDGFEFVLQTDPEAVAQEGDQNMGFDPGLKLMPDGAKVQDAFERSEDALHFGQLKVITPEGFGILPGEVGP